MIPPIEQPSAAAMRVAEKAVATVLGFCGLDDLPELPADHPNVKHVVQVVTDIIDTELATIRREAFDEAIRVTQQAVCGMCRVDFANVLFGPAVKSPDGHWNHLWNSSGSYCQRCEADKAISALETTRDREGTK